MSEQRDKALDNSVAHALRIGAYIGFSILLIALLTRPFVRAETFLYISRIGVLAMMATPWLPRARRLSRLSQGA